MSPSWCVAPKRKSTRDSSEKIGDQDRCDNDSKIVHGAVEKPKKLKFKFIDPKNSKF